MEVKQCETFWARIYMAGNIENAKNTCRKYCQIGLCVNIFETDYIYTWGEEIGFCVEIINYPRFPADKEVILQKADELAERLMFDCYQSSYTIMTPSETCFYSRRDELKH